MDDRDEDQDDDALTPRRPTAAELRRHRETYPEMPVLAAEPEPEPEPDDDLGVLYSEPPSPRDHEAVRRARRDPGAPVVWAELSTVIRLLRGQLSGDLAQLRDTVHGAPGRPGLTETVANHGQVIGPAKSAASWALRGAVAALLALGGFLYWRGRDEQHVIDEIQQLTDRVSRLERLIEAPNQTKDRTP